MGHIHEHIDFTITVFIVFDSKVLLISHPRYGKWIAPGGHIELDEDPEQALLREVEEETGLEVEILSEKPGISSPGHKFLYTPNYLDIHEANPPHRHIGMVYFARAKNDAFVLSDEHEDFKWFSIPELDDEIYDLSPAVKYYAKSAIKQAKA